MVPFGRLIEKSDIYQYLKESGALDDTLLIVTGDHGECFGEHSTIRPNVRLADHTTGIHDRQVHVPLLIRTAEGQSETISEPASLTGLHDVITSVLKSDINIEPLTDYEAVSAVDTNRRIIKGGDDVDKYLKKWDIDMSQFEGFSRVLYTREKDTIQRYATWGDDTEPSNIPDEIISIMEYSDKGVALSVSSDAATRQRLKNLGYL